MQYTSNTNELLERMKAIRQSLETGDFGDAVVAGLNTGMALMKRRIFNQSLDANGVFLGPYFSEQYARDRRRDGRQTARKDLENRGSVRRSIEVVLINNRRAEIRITNARNAEIARYQEQQIYNLRANLPANSASGQFVPIFKLNATELEIVRTTTLALLRQKFNF